MQHACKGWGPHEVLGAGVAQAYFILDEMLIAGELQEPSKKVSMGPQLPACLRVQWPLLAAVHRQLSGVISIAGHHASH